MNETNLFAQFYFGPQLFQTFMHKPLTRSKVRSRESLK